MTQISITPDLYQRLQEYAQHHQRQVDEVAQEILSAAISPPSPTTSHSIDDLLQALDRISGSLELDNSEERIRNHDQYASSL